MTKQAFTLIELVAAMLIVSVIACMAIPSFIKTVDSAKQKDLTIKLRTLYALQQNYYNEKGEYLQAGLEMSACYFDLDPITGIDMCVSQKGGANQIINSIGDNDTFSCTNTECRASSGRVNLFVELNRPLSNNNPRVI